MTFFTYSMIQTTSALNESVYYNAAVVDIYSIGGVFADALYVFMVMLPFFIIGYIIFKIAGVTNSMPYYSPENNNINKQTIQPKDKVVLKDPTLPNIILTGKDKF